MLRTLLSLFALDAAILCARYGLTIRRIRSGTHFFAVWFALAFGFFAASVGIWFSLDRFLPSGVLYALLALLAVFLAGFCAFCLRVRSQARAASGRGSHTCSCWERRYAQTAQAPCCNIASTVRLPISGRIRTRSASCPAGRGPTNPNPRRRLWQTTCGSAASPPRGSYWNVPHAARRRTSKTACHSSRLARASAWSPTTSTCSAPCRLPRPAGSPRSLASPPPPTGSSCLITCCGNTWPRSSSSCGAPGADDAFPARSGRFLPQGKQTSFPAATRKGFFLPVCSAKLRINHPSTIFLHQKSRRSSRLLFACPRITCG